MSIDATILHADAFVVDGHADTFEAAANEGVDLLARRATGHLDLPRQRAAGIDLQIQAVFTPRAKTGDVGLAYALDMAAAVLATLARSDGGWRLIRTREQLDLLTAAPPAERVPSVLLHLEGVSPLDGRLERLALFEAVGFRSVGLTHDHASGAAGGCSSPPEEDQLTDFGRQLIGALDRRGWLIDVAHLGPRSLDQLLEIARGPLVSSHTGMGALRPRPRNLTDDQARAIAASGGLVAIDFVPQHLRTELPASREDVFAHIDHAVSLLGDAHVGIGSDFDGYETELEGMAGGDDYPWLTGRMVAAGYPEASIRAILGGNFRRVLETVLGRRAG